MDKEEILKRSRKENEGVDGEYERTVFSEASRISVYVGFILCIALTLLSRHVFKSPEVAFAGGAVLFSMMGSRDITMFIRLKEKQNLVFGIISIIFALAYIGALVYLWMTNSY